ncbi:MAG: gliding motility-associated C-terminal domain-containing protein [Bacteroidales bacterium]
MKHSLCRCLLPLLLIVAMVGTEGLYAGSVARETPFYEANPGYNTYPGWELSGQVEVDCDSLTVSIEAPDGLMHCPESVGEVSFSASATYLSGEGNYDPGQFSYVWNIGEQEYSGSEISHVFSDPGAYPVRVTVKDEETGCVANALEVLKVGTYPTFSETTISADTVCAGEMVTLYGVANPTVWTGFPTVVQEDPPVFVAGGDLYESSLDFDVFSEGVEVLSADDFDRVCVNVEHVDQSQLRFELESPDGTVIELKGYGGVTANLGEPVVWEDDVPGSGYQYCFSPSPRFGRMDETSPQYHEYSDNAGNYYFNAAHLPSGTYTPDESLNNFAGSSLNGTWTMRVEDGAEGATGHVLGWSLFFDEGFYPDSLIFTPEIVDYQWYQNGSPVQGNPAGVTAEEQGDHQFLLEVTDNFGCTYDTTVTVNVLPLPEAEINSELEIPICEGDSTLLTVNPLNNDGNNWVYQWQLEGQDLPDRTRDTLMVKNPGTYTVMIEDTISGCMSFIDIAVSDQNCDLTIPNVYTPNADGVNDEFEILNLEHYPNAQIVIYNRWGDKVFEHHDYYNNWWDGNNAPDGVYFYVLKYSRMGETRHAEGSVTIIR